MTVLITIINIFWNNSSADHLWVAVSEFVLKPWSRLFYSTKTKHEWHEGDTSDTSPHECNTSVTRATQVRHKWHECDMSAR